MIRIGSFAELIVPLDRDTFEASVENALRSGTRFRTEFRVVWPNETLHWIEARGAAAPGDATLWRGVMVDVTERKDAELALLNEKVTLATGPDHPSPHHAEHHTSPDKATSQHLEPYLA